MDTPMNKRRALCDESGTRYYGGSDTIHQTGEINVEIHDGEVVAVWFRCAALPFTVSDHGADRAAEMKRMYAEAGLPRIVGLELRDPV